TKSSNTRATVSRLTPLTVVIAMPSFCTSRGPMCLSTSAACASPSERSTTAARCEPVRDSRPGRLSLFAFHPVAHHVGDPARVAAHCGAGDLQLLVEVQRRIGRAGQLGRWRLAWR